MTSKAKIAWLVLFSFSVVMMVMGILDGLHHNYSSAMMQIGIGLIFFSDVFDVDFFIQPVSFQRLFTPSKVEPFSPVTLIYYLGCVLWVIGGISWLLQ